MLEATKARNVQAWSSTSRLIGIGVGDSKRVISSNKYEQETTSVLPSADSRLMKVCPQADSKPIGRVGTGFETRA